MTPFKYSDYINKKTFAFGVNKLNSYTAVPTYSIKYNGNESSSYSTNRVEMYSIGEKITPNLMTNISSAKYNNVNYIKSTEIEVIDTNLLEINSSSNVIGNITISGFTISGDSKVAIGNSISLSATIDNASSAYTKTFTWESSDSSIASVNSSGVVTGIKKGSVTITVCSNDGDRITSSMVVNVFDPNAAVKVNYYGVVTNGVYDATAANGAASTVSPGDEITLNSALVDSYVLSADKNGTADSVQNWYKFSHWNVTLVNSDGTETSTTVNASTKYTIPNDFDGQTIKITGVYNSSPNYYKYKLVISGTYKSISSTSGIVNGVGTYWLAKDEHITVTVVGSKSLLGGSSRTCTISGTTFVGNSSSITSKGSWGLSGESSTATGSFYMVDNYVSLSTN